MLPIFRFLSPHNLRAAGRGVITRHGHSEAVEAVELDPESAGVMLRDPS
jgi:hypothetical protein